MKRAIVSGFSGDNWRRIVAKTWPLMERYAVRHGAVFLGEELRASGRPASWDKLPAIAKALSIHDEVIWLDADVSVSLATEDIFSEFDAGSSCGLCWLTDAAGRGHFNCGVLAARRGFLYHMTVAAMCDDCINDSWWEQAAINRLISAGELTVCRLSERWNVWSGSRGVDCPQFRHACGLGSVEDRIQWLGLD